MAQKYKKSIDSLELPPLPEIIPVQKVQEALAPLTAPRESPLHLHIYHRICVHFRKVLPWKSLINDL